MVLFEIHVDMNSSLVYLIEIINNKISCNFVKIKGYFSAQKYLNYPKHVNSPIKWLSVVLKRTSSVRYTSPLMFKLFRTLIFFFPSGHFSEGCKHLDNDYNFEYEIIPTISDRIVIIWKKIIGLERLKNLDFLVDEASKGQSRALELEFVVCVFAQRFRLHFKLVYARWLIGALCTSCVPIELTRFFYHSLNSSITYS